MDLGIAALSIHHSVVEIMFRNFEATWMTSCEDLSIDGSRTQKNQRFQKIIVNRKALFYLQCSFNVKCLNMV